MKSPRYDLISCRCAVYGWLLYLGGLGVSALWLQSDAWLCTADTITPVLEWSLLSTLISSAIWSQKGPLDLVFRSPACCRLFKQAVPWLRPLTCATETCLFRKRICPPHPWEMPWFFPCFCSCFIDGCEYLLSSLYMNLSDLSVNFWLLLLSCTEIEEPFPDLLLPLCIWVT